MRTVNSIEKAVHLFEIISGGNEEYEEKEAHEGREKMNYSSVYFTLFGSASSLRFLREIRVLPGTNISSYCSQTFPNKQVIS